MPKQPEPEAINYQLIKDDADKFRQFFERFIRLSDMLAAFGPTKQGLDALESAIAERKADLVALDQRKERETRELGENAAAAMRAAETEAERVVQEAHAEATRLKAEASAEVAKINAAGASEQAAQLAALDKQVAAAKQKITKLTAESDALDRQVADKQAELAVAEQKHAELAAKIEGVKQVARRALEGA